MQYIKLKIPTPIKGWETFVRVITIRSKEVKQTDVEESADDLHLAFKLQYFHKEYDSVRPINTSKIINRRFIDTTFDELDEFVIMDKI